MKNVGDIFTHILFLARGVISPSESEVILLLDAESPFYLLINVLQETRSEKDRMKNIPLHHPLPIQQQPTAKPSIALSFSAYLLK